MIDLKKQDNGLLFMIGDTGIPVSKQDAASLGDLLRHESVEKIADSTAAIRIGEWSLAGALDEENERERDLAYRRILLGHAGKTWHLSRQEAVMLGSRFRTESSVE